MACFIVPTTEALIVSAANIIIEKQMMKKKTASEGQLHDNLEEKPAVCRNLSLLSKLLWGGSALLAFEHLWHGEIQPFYPFLTAASDPAAMSEVFHEMATVGVSMAVAVTLAWGILIFFRSRLAVQAQQPQPVLAAAASTPAEKK